MASHEFDDLKILGPHRRVIAGSFAPNGGGAVDATSVRGRGFTVARTGAGEWTVTLTETFPLLESWWLDLQLAAATDLKLQLGAADPAGARTIVIRAVAIAAPTDIAADAANRVAFGFVFRNTTSDV